MARTACGPVANCADPVTAWTGSELFVGGGASCDNGRASGEPHDQANLLNPASGVWRNAAPAPVGFSSSSRYPDIWTGTAVATVSPGVQPLLYNTTTDEWHLGPKINGAHPIALNQSPIVEANNTIIVSEGNITQDGDLCCEPFQGTDAYTIPKGF